VKAAKATRRVKTRLSTKVGQVIFAKFDSAQTSDRNKNHWAWADSLSADAAASAAVRQKLRDRARYEVANNSYARGIVNTLANDCVGTGPRLQLLDAGARAGQVEADFELWARAVKLAKKLRTMRMARCQDGEAFAIRGQNALLRTVVKLDIRLVEADQVRSPWAGADSFSAVTETDGITLDEWGDPVSYSVSKEHPGGTSIGGLLTDSFITIPASDMLHLFGVDRPGQHRGIPEIQPALPLFALLRRYTLAEVSAAETAANFAAVMHGDAPPDGEAEDDPDAMDEIEIPRNGMLTLPAGWKMSQFKAEHPSTGHVAFKRSIMSEAARCVDMPLNVALGDSSESNYASGRLDYQMYGKKIEIDRDDIESVVLDPILADWLREYELATGVRVSGRHEWFWPGREHVDPVKEANAQKTRLESLTTTLSEECAKQGLDWEDVLDQRARELKKMKALGLLVAPASSRAVIEDDSDEDDAEGEEE